MSVHDVMMSVSKIQFVVEYLNETDSSAFLASS